VLVFEGISYLDKPEQRDSSTPHAWFATPVWSRKVVDHVRINTGIKSGAARLEAGGGELNRSNVGGWHSHDQIHREPEFAEIAQIIGSTCIGCARFLGFDFAKSGLTMSHMWLNKNGPGDFNKPHIHPNSILSGAYYAQFPPHSGNIEFHDPVPARSMIVFPTEGGEQGNSQTIEYRGEEGLLLVFPSWLLHSVQPNRSGQFRISISFNAGFEAPRMRRP